MNCNREDENPDNKKHLQKSKWSILIVSSLLLMGSCFAYDVPYAIKEHLKTKFSNIFPNDQEFETNFDLLYTVYVFPNIFLPFLNSMITEKVQKTIDFL